MCCPGPGADDAGPGKMSGKKDVLGVWRLFFRIRLFYVVWRGELSLWRMDVQYKLKIMNYDIIIYSARLQEYFSIRLYCIALY